MSGRTARVPADPWYAFTMVDQRRLVAFVGSIALGVGLLAGLARALGADGGRTGQAALFGALAGYGLVTLIVGLRASE